MQLVARLVSLTALTGYVLVSNAVNAQSPPTLTGPRVITFRYLYVPFTTSEVQIRQGKKNASGACTFPVDLSVRRGQLAAGQKMLRVQRAYDPDTCEELVETGLVQGNFSFPSEGTDVSPLDPIGAPSPYQGAIPVLPHPPP